MEENNINYKTTSNDYGTKWLVDPNRVKSLKELGENDIKLRYLEKSFKSQRRIAQREEEKQNQIIETQVNEKFKYDKNAVLAKKFPFTSEQIHYPNEGKEKPKSLFITYNDEYGKKKPNDLELPEKFYPINDKFTCQFTSGTYRNNSLNTTVDKSKVHHAFDSII